MPLPTMTEVVHEINFYRYNIYPKTTSQILEQLQRLSQDNIEQFNDHLVNLLNAPQYDKRFKKTMYKAILVLGQLFPRNSTQVNQIIDPITLGEIEPHDLFISLDRYHWSIRSLIKSFSNKNTYINPLTNVEFSPLNIYHIQKMAIRHGLTIMFRNNNVYRSNLDQGGDNYHMNFNLSQIYRFFKTPNTALKNENAGYPLRVVAFPTGVVFL